MEWCSRALILGVILKCCVGFSLYPGIFDPNPFIPKMSPQVLKVTLGQQYQQAPVVHSFSGGDTGDGEVGYVRSDSESGSGGFRHSEHFHKKDGNEYEHEKQVGYGESKDEDDDHGHEKSDSVRKYDSDDDHEQENDRIYEVNEDNSDDHVNPHQHTTYGVAPTKQKKKKIQLIPEFGTRLTLPKKTSHKKNHNGYETVIYHENEKKGTEKGYDWRNRHNAPPKSVVIAHKDEQPREPEYDERQKDEEEEEEHVREEGEDRDQHPDDNEDDDGDQSESERSDYGDNYNSYRYRDDEGEEDRGNDREADRRSGGGGKRRHERRGSGRNNYDYDEEVDREEIDESANEDKYYGADYDDDDYGRHQYEYASEADYDAQR